VFQQARSVSRTFRPGERLGEAGDQARQSLVMEIREFDWNQHAAFEKFAARSHGVIVAVPARRTLGVRERMTWLPTVVTAADMAETLTLFDEIVGVDDGPARYAEPSFPYWNRSARRDINHVRIVLEEWFREYPPEHAADLRGRFRSSNDVQHRGAFFELFLHAMLRRLDCAVEVHPELPGTTKRPEFRVRTADGVLFYLEAKVAGDESPEKAGERARISLVYDAINDLDSPDYWINVELRTSPATQVKRKKLKEFLREQLSSLDYEDLLLKYRDSGFDEMPRWGYESEGWSAVLFPIPKGAARGEHNVRPLGFQFTPIHEVDTVTPLRSAILEKAKRYGTPDLPFVIAINFVGEHMNGIDEVSALFGDETLVIRSPDGSAELRRVPNGVWTSPQGQYRRVSGVLIFRRLNAWNFPSAVGNLYHHVAADKPLTGELTRLQQVIPVDGELKVCSGEPLGQLFGISPDWLDVFR
jgi:hypothetical protein